MYKMNNEKMLNENDFLKDIVKGTLKGSTRLLTQGEGSTSKDKSEELDVHAQVSKERFDVLSIVFQKRNTNLRVWMNKF